jgi:hypothetical protein
MVGEIKMNKIGDSINDGDLLKQDYCHEHVVIAMGNGTRSTVRWTLSGIWAFYYKEEFRV